VEEYSVVNLVPINMPAITRILSLSSRMREYRASIYSLFLITIGSSSMSPPQSTIISAHSHKNSRFLLICFLFKIHEFFAWSDAHAARRSNGILGAAVSLVRFGPQANASRRWRKLVHRMPRRLRALRSWTYYKAATMSPDSSSIFVICAAND